MTKDELLDFLKFASIEFDAELRSEEMYEDDDGGLHASCSEVNVDKVWNKYIEARPKG